MYKSYIKYFSIRKIHTHAYIYIWAEQSQLPNASAVSAQSLTLEPQRWVIYVWPSLSDSSTICFFAGHLKVVDNSDIVFLKHLQLPEINPQIQTYLFSSTTFIINSRSYMFSNQRYSWYSILPILLIFIICSRKPTVPIKTAHVLMFSTCDFVTLTLVTC